jgi:hypothetical protein
MVLIDEYNSISIDEFLEQKNEVPGINTPKINKNSINS